MIRYSMAGGVLLLGCGGSASEPEMAPGDGLDSTQSAAEPGEMGEAPPDASQPEPGGGTDDVGEADERWSIGEAKANGVKAENESGAQVEIGTLAFVAFERISGPNAETEGADVVFGEITADDTTIFDVSCKLPSWDVPTGDGAGAGVAIATTAVIGLAAQDAIAAVAPVFSVHDELAKCGLHSDATVRLQFQDSRIVGVAVDGAGGAAVCVQSALEGATAFDVGDCTMTVKP